MKIAILCSLAFAKEAGEVAQRLEAAGHEVSLPFTVQDILDGVVTVEEIEELKQDESFSKRTVENDLIRRNWSRIQGDDAVVVVNETKKGIEGYIGANTFLEIGFAYVLGKKIFIWNGLPDMDFHKDELLSMSPVILNVNVNNVV